MQNAIVPAEIQAVWADKGLEAPGARERALAFWYAVHDRRNIELDEDEMDEEEYCFYPPDRLENVPEDSFDEECEPPALTASQIATQAMVWAPPPKRAATGVLGPLRESSETLWARDERLLASMSRDQAARALLSQPLTGYPPHTLPTAPEKTQGFAAPEKSDPFGGPPAVAATTGWGSTALPVVTPVTVDRWGLSNGAALTKLFALKI